MFEFECRFHSRERLFTVKFLVNCGVRIKRTLPGVEIVELDEVTLFENLSSESLDRVRNQGEIWDLDDGEILFQRGESGEELYVVLEGMIQISIPDELSEKGITLALLGEGEIVGEMAVLTDRDRSAQASAMRPSRLFRLGGKEFEELTQDHPEIALNLSRVLGHRLWETDSEMQRVAFNTLKSRLASQILRMGEKFGEEVEDGTKIDFNLTHEMLADIVGTYRETITKKISNFKEKGIIGEQDGKIVITNRDRLEHISKG